MVFSAVTHFMRNAAQLGKTSVVVVFIYGNTECGWEVRMTMPTNCVRHVALNNEQLQNFRRGETWGL
jgi:hypothetical protein